jgi:hypothetical protein
MDLDGDFPSPEGEQQTDESIFSQDNDASSMAAFADPNPMGSSTIGSTSASSGMGQPSLDILTPQTTQSLFHNLGKSRFYHNCNN